MDMVIREYDGTVRLVTSVKKPTFRFSKTPGFVNQVQIKVGACTMLVVSSQFLFL